MHRLFSALLLVTFIGDASAFNSELAGLYECLRSIEPYSSINDTSDTRDTSVFDLSDTALNGILIPQTNIPNENAFFVLRDNEIEACQLGNPYRSNSQYDYYYLRTSANRQGEELYITYSDPRNTTGVALGYGPRALPANEGKYRDLNCSDRVNGQSIAVVRSIIIDRIQTVKASYGSRYNFALEEGDKPPGIDEYRDSLDSCKEIGGEISVHALREIGKFPEVSQSESDGGSSSEN